MAYHRLDGAASSQQFRDGSGDAATGTADEDFDGLDAVAAITAIDKGHGGALIGQDLHLFQRLVQRVAIVGIAWQRTHSNDEAAFSGGGDGDLGAELVALVRLALGDAIHGWFVQAVELPAVLRLLRQQPVHQRHQILQLCLQRPLGHLVHLSFDVAQHAPGIALEPAQRLAHPLELPGMGIAANLNEQPGAEAVVVLAQTDARVTRQRDELAPCSLVEPGIRRMHDVLFHHRGIDREDYRDPAMATA